MFAPGLAPIALAVEATLFSAYVRGLKPLSLFLIAPVGSGKTELLSCYAHNKGVRLFNDLTAYGLCSTLNEIKAGIVRHILIPDVLRLTARSSTVRRQILATLNSLTEEGITRIETFNIRFSSMQPVRAGVIAAITTDEWRARRRSWMRIGFLSRAIPISYTLAPEDILRGEELIYSGKEAFKPIDLIFPEEPVDVEIPLNMKDKLKRIAYALAAVNRDETRFRSHKHVIAMAKSLALRAGRRSVVDEDIATLKALSIFWLSPYTGDEPSYRILRNLPGTIEQIHAQIKLYSKATIRKRLKMLEKLGIVRNSGGIWVMEW